MGADRGISAIWQASSRHARLVSPKAWVAGASPAMTCGSVWGRNRRTEQVALLRLLHPGHRIAREPLLGFEGHLVADLHLLEHGRVLDAVDHGHGFIHAEVLLPSLPERGLSG